jgi:hypothetical protein
MLNTNIECTEYVVYEKFWLGGMNRYAVYHETLLMDCLTADILVKYGVLLPRLGIRYHDDLVARFNQMCDVTSLKIGDKEKLKDALAAHGGIK